MNSIAGLGITFWYSLGGAPGEVLKELVQEYNQEHDQSPVDLVFVNPQEYASSAKNALQLLSESSKDSSKIPNLVLAPEYMTGDMLQAEEKGHVVSIGSLLDENRKDDIAEIVKMTFGPHCLPLNPACGILYVNQTLLEEVGEDPHWKPASLEDLAEMSRKLVESGKVEKGYTCAWPEAYLVEAVLAQQNRSLLDQEGHYCFSHLADHIFDMWKLVKQGVFLPPATGNYDPTRQFFLDRKVAFYMQGSGHAPLIAGDFKVGYAPLPMLAMGQKEKFAFPLGGAAIWVLNKKIVEGVRSFINYLASKKAQEQWHIKTAYVPVSKSLVDDLHEFYQTHPLHAAVVSQTIGSKVGENSFGIKKPGYSDVRKALYPMIRELITQEGEEGEVRNNIGQQLENFDKKWNS